MPLCQPHTCFVSHQLAVKITWPRQPERTLQKNLPSGRSQQIATADDFRDVHCCVVDNAGKLITWQSIFSPHNKIAEIRAISTSGPEALRPSLSINEANHLFVRHTKSIVRLRL